MKIKKTVRLLSLVLCCILLFTSCTPNATKAVKEVETVQGAGEVAGLEPVTLTWYVVGSPQNDQDAVMEEINKILKEKINVTLDLIILDWGVYDEKIKITIGSNEAWDLCFTSSWSNNYASNAMKGAYLPLDEYIDEYAANYKAQVPTKYLDATVVEGNMYGFVNYQNEYLVRSFTAQQEILNKYSLEEEFLAIKSWQDLEPILEVIKQNEPNITPLYALMLPFPELFNLETGFTIDFLQGNSMNPLAIHTADSDTKVFNGVESPEFMELAKLWRSWYEKGYIRKDQISRKDYTAEMSTGTYGVISSIPSSSFNNSLDLENAYVHPSYNLKTLSVDYVPNYINTGSVIATLTAVNQNSKNKERAIMLYDLLHADKELYNLLCYGIEGVHYTHVDENTISPIADSGYLPAINWEFGNTFNGFAESTQKPGYLEDVLQKNEDAIASPLLGFSYNTDNVKQADAQINALLEEYVPAIMSGSVDPEKAIPELVEKMNTAGMQEIFKDAQKQIDDWKSVNK